MDLKKTIQRGGFKLLQGRLSPKTLKRAKRKAEKIKIKNEQKSIIAKMKLAGVGVLNIYYVIEDDVLKSFTDPDIGIDALELDDNTDSLVSIGFKYIHLEMNPRTYKIIQCEFDPEKVKEFMSNKERLFEGLTFAQKMEGKIE